MMNKIPYADTVPQTTEFFENCEVTLDSYAILGSCCQVLRMFINAYGKGVSKQALENVSSGHQKKYLKVKT